VDVELRAGSGRWLGKMCAQEESVFGDGVGLGDDRLVVRSMSFATLSPGLDDEDGCQKPLNLEIFLPRRSKRSPERLPRNGRGRTRQLSARGPDGDDDATERHRDWRGGDGGAGRSARRIRSQTGNSRRQSQRRPLPRPLPAAPQDRSPQPARGRLRPRGLFYYACRATRLSASPRVGTGGCLRRQPSEPTPHPRSQWPSPRPPRPSSRVLLLNCRGRRLDGFRPRPDRPLRRPRPRPRCSYPPPTPRT